MALVRLDITPTPAHVRTARLVATAVARQAGVEDTSLDEIRLAVGEACSRAVNLHREHVPDRLVTLLLEDGRRFTVTVIDEAPVGADVSDVDPMDLIDGTDAAPDAAVDQLPSGFGLAVIDGLVDDLRIDPVDDAGGTRVTMSWPARSPTG